MTRLIYLGSPYTDPDPDVENVRAEAICRIAGELVKRGHYLFCPIAHNHRMNRICGLGGSFEYWRKYDEMMLSLCTDLWIVKLDGWTRSKGLRAERILARRLDKPVRYINPQTLEFEGPE